MRYVGTSSTGSKHELEVLQKGEAFRFSLLGPTGKRHGAVTMDAATVVEMASYILLLNGRLTGDGKEKG